MKWFEGWRRRRAEQRIKRHIERVHMACEELQLAMMVTGIGRAERRQIWRQIISGKLSPSDLVGRD